MSKREEDAISAVIKESFSVDEFTIADVLELIDIPIPYKRAKEIIGSMASVYACGRTDGNTVRYRSLATKSGAARVIRPSDGDTIHGGYRAEKQRDTVGYSGAHRFTVESPCYNLHV